MDWSNPALMYTCGYAGLRKTTNEGVTWATVSLPTRNYLQTITLDPQSVSTIHGAGYYYDTAAIGLYARSTNGGTSWSTKLLTSRRSYMYCVTVAPTNTQMVFVGGYDVDSLTFAHWQTNAKYERWLKFFGLHGSNEWDGEPCSLRSPNGWQGLRRLQRGGIPEYRLGNDLDHEQWDRALSPTIIHMPSEHGRPPGRYVDYGIYRSTNGGSSWEAVTSGMPSAHPKAVLIEPGNPSVMYAATTAGFCRSTNGGGQWVWSSRRIRAASVSTLAFARRTVRESMRESSLMGYSRRPGALGMGTVAWQPTG